MSTAYDTIFGNLNDMQKKAVETVNGPMLILAGAGSGKTRTITHRIAYLIANGVPAWQILAVTFTNKSAKELKERITRILKITDEHGAGQQQMPTAGTFHSVCVRMLRRDIEKTGGDRNFVIYDSDDQEKLMSQTLKDMNIAPEELKPRAALSWISGFKSEALKVGEARSKATTHMELRMADVYDTYQKSLRAANAFDFDDLLLQTVRMLEEFPDILARYQETWKFIHVDEYQDTNKVQYLLISLLAGKYRNLCVIGDPDQSIYAFRGADIRNILDFKKEYADGTIITLEQNYRSTQPILDGADGVISVNPGRPPKKMWTERKEGAKITLHEVHDERKEAEEALKIVQEDQKKGVSPAEQVILYRTNAQSRLFEEAAIRAGVPYRIVGGVKFYARKEVKDVLAYLFTILNPNDTISLLRIINVPPRKIGATTLGRLQNYCNERSISLWQGLGHIGMVEGINEPTRQRIAGFVEMMEGFRAQSETMVVSELASSIVSAIGLEKHIQDGTDEGLSRWENVLELLSVTHKYDQVEPKASLMNFLEEVALVSEVDKLDDKREDALTLMTLHLCKGLEFRTVIVSGCEDGILPHGAALIDKAQMEEERRLMYVGMTRAKDHLHMMHAVSRTLWGNTQTNARSRFLADIPMEVVELKSPQMDSRFGWLTSSGNTKSRSSASDFDFNQDHQFHPVSDSQENGWVAEEQGIGEGTRVSHRVFGPGTVKSRAGDIVEISFDDGRTKRLALSIAPLKLLSEAEVG
jgi:DNA helicase II / ATP-dependent DNA helicase PcrA